MNNFRSGLTNVEHFNKMGNPSNGPAMMKWFYILVKCSFLSKSNHTRWRYLVVSGLLLIFHILYQSTLSGLLQLKMDEITHLALR